MNENQKIVSQVVNEGLRKLLLDEFPEMKSFTFGYIQEAERFEVEFREEGTRSRFVYFYETETSYFECGAQSEKYKPFLVPYTGKLINFAKLNIRTFQKLL